MEADRAELLIARMRVVALLFIVLFDGIMWSAGPEKVGEAFYAKNRKWSEDGATPLALGAGLCTYLASRESDGISGRLISAQWDAWPRLHEHRAQLAGTDIYCLRRIVPEDRGCAWK